MPETERIAIYALLDHSSKICYIGQSSNVARRLSEHFNGAATVVEQERCGNAAKKRWLSQVERLSIRVLCYCDTREEAARREAEFMGKALIGGWELRNKTYKTRVHERN